MSAPIQGDFVPVEHDTFLDIVTNVVGILVILVMLVALQARDMPATSSGEATATATPQLAAERAEATALTQEVQQMRAAGEQLAGMVRNREMERQYMATIKAKAEREVADMRSSLSTEGQKEFELRRRLAVANAQLDQLDRQRVQLAAVDGKVVEVKSYPTPLGKSVFGREVHFQLREGRIAYLPIEELIDDAKNEVRQKDWKLEGQPETTEVIGPREGFRLRYTLERIDKVVEVPGRGTQRLVGAQAKHWELIPTDSALGEPIADAFKQNSRFSQTLTRFDPAQTTVTLWTYPDSFGDFRKLKAELFRRGFATAGRPLPEGMPVGGSPQGTRSSAE